MKDKISIIKIIIIGIVSLLSIFLIGNVATLDLIPSKYLFLIIGAIIVINLLADACLLVKKKWTKIISVILYIPLIVVSIIGTKYLSSTNDFFDKAFDNYKTEIIHYNVIVKVNDSYNSLKDLKNKDIAYFTFYDDIDTMLNEVKKEYKNANFKPHDDIYDTFVNFFANQVTSIIVDDGYFEEMKDTYPDLDDKVRIIYTYSIETKVKENNEETTTTKASNEETTTTRKSYSKINKGESINIYISGSDSRKKTLPSKTRSDVNMVLSINPKTKTILMTSIPRDYYVWVYGKTGLKDKLTHAGIYGLNVSKRTVENLFDIDIDYAVKVGMPAVVELVDLVGGIEVYSDTEFDSYHMKGWHVNKGMNSMDGEHALAYARERYAYASGDRHRVKNQQQVLEATFKKLASDASILLKYEELLSSLKNLYMTDMPRSVISKYVKMQLDDMASWKFISQSVDGKGKMTATYTAPKSKRYVMVPNESSVEKARNKMKEVLEAK